MTLIETSMWLTLAGILAATLANLATGYRDAEVAQREARELTQLADTALDAALQDTAANLAAVGGTNPRARLVTIADLPGYSAAATRTSAGGRALQLAHWRNAANEIMIVAWAATPAAWPRTPRMPSPGEGIAGVGLLSSDHPCGAATVCGPGVRWTATAALTALGASRPADGSLVALRHIDADPAADTFLRHADNGVPAFNRIAAALDANGASVVNGGRMTAASAEASTSMRSNGALAVQGLVETDTAEITDQTDIGGTLTIANGIETAVFEGASLEVAAAAAASAGRLVSNGTTELHGAVTVSGTIETPRVAGTATVVAPEAVAHDITGTTAFTSPALDAHVAASADLTVTALTVVRELRVQSCTGLGCR